MDIDSIECLTVLCESKIVCSGLVEDMSAVFQIARVCSIRFENVYAGVDAEQYRSHFYAAALGGTLSFLELTTREKSRSVLRDDPTELERALKMLNKAVLGPLIGYECGPNDENMLYEYGARVCKLVYDLGLWGSVFPGESFSPEIYQRRNKLRRAERRAVTCVPSATKFLIRAIIVAKARTLQY